MRRASSFPTVDHPVATSKNPLYFTLGALQRGGVRAVPRTRTYNRKLNFSVRAKLTVVVSALLFLCAALAPFIVSLQSEAWQAANAPIVTGSKGAYAVAEGLSMGAIFALTLKIFFKFSLTTIVEVVRQVIQPFATPAPARTGEITIRLTEMPPEGLQAMIDTQTADLAAQLSAAIAERDALNSHLRDAKELAARQTAEAAAARKDHDKALEALKRTGQQVASLEADNTTLKSRVASDSRILQVARRQVELLAGHEGNLRDGLKELAAELNRGAQQPG